MKKKVLLFVLMLTLVVCAFVISVSAHDTTRKVTLDNGTVVDLYDADNEALTWYLQDGNLVSKKTKDVITVNGSGVASYSGISTMNVVVANFQGAEVEALNVKQVPVYYYGSNGGGYHSYNDTIEYIYLPDTLTTTVTNQFRCTSKLKIVDVTRNSNWTTMGQYSFYYATGLTEFYYPPKVKTTPGGGNDGSNGTAATFASCKSLKSLYFYDNSEVETFGNACFCNCIALENVELPDSLTSTPASLFSGCTSLKELRVPNSVTTVGERLVQDCTNLEKLWLPSSITSIGQSLTYRASSLGCVYLPKTVVTATGTHHFTTQHTTYTKTVIFFNGNETEANAFVALLQSRSNNEKFSNGNYSIIAWDPEISDATYFENAKNEGKNYIVYGYDTCEAFYKGIHELDPDKSNACAGICKNCGELSLSANPEHVEKVVITFADLTKIGTKVTTCDNANCPYHVSEEIPAVFTYAGVSADIATHQFVTVGYLINQDSLNAYMSTLENGVAFSYGFVATATTADTAINGTPISAETGAVTAGNMLQINLSTQENIENCSAVDFKMAGNFTVEKHLNANLGIALYTMTRTTSAGVDTYTVKYLGESGESATLTSFTFAEKITQGE